MSAKMTLGQTAEIAGPKKAFIFPKPEVAASMIKRAKRPLLIVGSDSEKTTTIDGDLIDTAIRIHNNKHLTIVATGHMIGEFRKRGVFDVYGSSIMNLGERLKDPEWKGFDEKDQYDLVIFMGLPYYIEWLIQSGLKNFAPSLRTISLDRSYQPNANWSLGSMNEKDWKEALDKIVSIIEEG